MLELLSYIRESLLGEWHGPLAFRLIVQPAVGAFLGIRAGLRDARAGRPPYGWQLLTRSGHREELIRDGWKDVFRLFIAAAVIDLIYQFIAFHRVYPAQALVLAAFLAIPTYFFARGPSTRVARRWFHVAPASRPSKRSSGHDRLP